MNHNLLEWATREWVEANPTRAAQELRRLLDGDALNAAQSAEEIADALIRIAGCIRLAETRVW